MLGPAEIVVTTFGLGFVAIVIVGAILVVRRLLQR